MEETWPEYLYSMVLVPYAYYMCWSVAYSWINFKWRAKTITKHKYYTSYTHFEAMPSLQNFLARHHLKMSPLIFMTAHFLMFTLTHCIALLSFHNVWVHGFVMLVYFLISVWNGANYYMEYFSKKYEKTLQELQELSDKTH